MVAEKRSVFLLWIVGVLFFGIGAISGLVVGSYLDHGPKCVVHAGFAAETPKGVVIHSVKLPIEGEMYECFQLLREYPNGDRWFCKLELEPKKAPVPSSQSSKEGRQ